MGWHAGMRHPSTETMPREYGMLHEESCLDNIVPFAPADLSSSILMPLDESPYPEPIKFRFLAG